MESADVIIPTASQAVQIESHDDPETGNAVRSQIKIEKVSNVVLLSICIIISVSGFRHGIGTVLISLVATFFIIYIFGGAMIGLLVFGPMRALRFGACVARMREIAGQSIDLVKCSTWKTPLPCLIAIDPAKQLLFVEGAGTDYRSLILRPHQILDAKVEREQTVETNTKQGARMVYSFGSSFSLGLIGGGRSKSTSRVIETAFLEISYVTDPNSAPARVVFPFGDQRREADDWVMAIQHMCGTGRG
jgi:hypothetical protein